MNLQPPWIRAIYKSAWIVLARLMSLMPADQFCCLGADVVVDLTPRLTPENIMVHTGDTVIWRAEEPWIGSVEDFEMQFESPIIGLDGISHFTRVYDLPGLFAFRRWGRNSPDHRRVGTNVEVQGTIVVVSHNPSNRRIWLNAPVSDAKYGVVLDATGHVLVSTEVTILCTVQDTNEVAEVEFLVDNEVIGTSPTWPFRWSWGPSKTGLFTIQARALRREGGTFTSEPVAIGVVGDPTPRFLNPRLVRPGLWVTDFIQPPGWWRLQVYDSVGTFWLGPRFEIAPSTSWGRAVLDGSQKSRFVRMYERH